MKAIINGKIILEKKILSNMVLLFDDKINDIITMQQYKNLNTQIVYDAKGKYVSAGFIDIHIHGAANCDVMDGTKEAIEAISRKIASFGVSGFLPTTMTMEWNKIYNSLSNIRNCMDKSFGAKILGCNLEGPFINRNYCGAQAPGYIMDPDFSLIEEYKKIIKLLTLAPELKNSDKFIKACVKENIAVSIGHSDASNDIVEGAIKSGVKSTTHMFNAMPQLHHREPGLIGAVMNNGDIYCELISDNIHVHPVVQNVLLKIKGIDKIILVSDSMRAAGMGKGVYELGGQIVLVDEASARLIDGTLAGSILTLNTALKNFKNNTGLSYEDVIKTVTVNPAKLLSIFNKKGSIGKGKDADIVIFDENFEIYNTFVEGSLLYSK